MTRTEQKNDEKLFEFLNSNVPAAKERKPVKPKVLVESSSETAVKPSDSVSELMQGDVADGNITEGEDACCLLFFIYLLFTDYHG